MQAIFVSVFLLFLPSKIHLEKEKNIFFIDFSDSFLQYDVDPNYDVEIHSTKEAEWIVPKEISQLHKVVLTNKKLQIKRSNNSLISGNFSLCPKDDFTKSILLSYEIPKCCPCCSWYNVKQCNFFYERIKNCTTIVFFAVSKLNSNVDLIKLLYENDVFLLPCPMKLSNLKDNLLIADFMYDETYLHSVNGTLQRNNKKFTFYPTVGLCFNTSEFKQIVTYIQCVYGDEKLQFVLEKVDLTSETIQSSLMLEDENNRTIYLKNTNVNVLQDSKLKIQCRAHYSSQRYLENVICMKLNIDDENMLDYVCNTMKHSLTKILVIESRKIRNNSRIICSTISPSKEIAKITETRIYKFPKEFLKIQHYNSLNNKVYEIPEIPNDPFEISVFYYSIPSTKFVKCSFVENDYLRLDINCSVTIAEQCQCRINIEKIHQKKSSANLTISISNGIFKESVNVILKPIYLEKPYLTGLTSKAMNYKNLSCNAKVSEPYNFTWNIEFNKKDKYIHYSIDNYMILLIPNNTNYVCVSCILRNVVGEEESDRVCKELLDVEMHDTKNVQIYLLDSIIWSRTKNVEKKKEFQFLGFKNQSVNILDTNSPIIKCASRNRKNRIELFLNNASEPLKNIKEIHSRFTRQITMKINFKEIPKFQNGFKFFCRQGNFSDSTYFLNVLKVIPPFISLKGDTKQRFLQGQDIHITIILHSFPLAELRLIKITESTTNSSNNGKLINQKGKIMPVEGHNNSFFIVKIIFKKVLNQDSGKYLIIASNIGGKYKFSFSLEEWESHNANTKVYIILGSLILFVVLCLVFVVFYCKRSGYAIPIIQIQNDIYKSLDGDSLQLLNIIWPDPLDRIRWTMKPSSRIKVKERIGGGNYGVIYTGIFKNTETTSDECVALKCPILTKPINNDKPKGPSKFCQISLDCFINEVRILSQLTNCPNIIKMYGCAIFRDWINEKEGIKEPTTMLVLEFCSNFSLDEFLSKNAAFYAPYTKYRKFTLQNGYTGMKMDEGITLLDLKRITLGIATGLEYINGLNIIHRDLASRNILIDEKKNPKICDFGLAVELDNDLAVSKSYQVLTYNKALPYKILAPEALECKTFYLESDIWSFSLLMWDIFNLEREVLFPNIDTPSELFIYINEKLTGINSTYILPMPRYADESIWDLIKSCWYLNPFDRPSAHSIRNKLVEIVRNNPVEVIRVNSYSHSDIYDQNGRESTESSVFPSTNTSIVTLNCSSTCTNNNGNICFGQCNSDFCNTNLIDESPL